MNWLEEARANKAEKDAINNARYQELLRKKLKDKSEAFKRLIKQHHRIIEEVLKLAKQNGVAGCYHGLVQLTDFNSISFAETGKIEFSRTVKSQLPYSAEIDAFLGFINKDNTLEVVDHEYFYVWELTLDPGIDFGSKSKYVPKNANSLYVFMVCGKVYQGIYLFDSAKDYYIKINDDVDTQAKLVTAIKNWLAKVV